MINHLFSSGAKQDAIDVTSGDVHLRVRYSLWLLQLKSLQETLLVTASGFNANFFDKYLYHSSSADNSMEPFTDLIHAADCVHQNIKP